MRIYLGKRRTDLQWEPFRPDKTPTEETHGARYSLAEGPFDNVQDAIERLEYRRALALP